MFDFLTESFGRSAILPDYLQASLDSVNQLAASTYSAFNREGSRESLSSLQSGTDQRPEAIENGSSSDLVSWDSPAGTGT